MLETVTFDDGSTLECKDVTGGVAFNYRSLEACELPTLRIYGKLYCKMESNVNPCHFDCVVYDAEVSDFVGKKVEIGHKLSVAIGEFPKPKKRKRVEYNYVVVETSIGYAMSTLVPMHMVHTSVFSTWDKAFAYGLERSVGEDVATPTTKEELESTATVSSFQLDDRVQWHTGNTLMSVSRCEVC